MLRLWNKRSVNKAWEHTFQFRDHCRRTQTRLQTLHFNKQCPFSHRFGLSELRRCQVQETPYGLRLTSFVKCLAFWLRGVLFKITWQSAYTHTTRTHTHSNAQGDICPSKWKTHSENCVLGYFLWMVGHQHQCRHFLLPSSFKCTSGIKSVLLAGNYMQNAFLPSPVVHDAARLDHCLWACVFFTCRHRQCEEYSALLTIKIESFKTICLQTIMMLSFIREKNYVEACIEFQ